MRLLIRNAWTAIVIAVSCAMIAMLLLLLMNVRMINDRIEELGTASPNHWKWAAWSFLYGDYPDTPRVQAMVALLADGENIEAVDFGCPSVTAGMTSNLFDHVFCPTETISFVTFDGKKTKTTPQWLDRANFGSRVFRDVEFSNFQIYRSDFRKTVLEHVDFSDVNLAAVSFENAVITSNFEAKDKDSVVPMVLSEVDFAKAKFEYVTFIEVVLLSANFTNADMRGINFAAGVDKGLENTPMLNVSGAILCADKDETDPRPWKDCVDGLTQQRAARFWFYADNPPIGLDHEKLSHLDFRTSCSREELNDQNVKQTGTADFFGYSCGKSHILD